MNDAFPDSDTVVTPVPGVFARHTRMQVVCAWGRHLLGYRLLRAGDRITVGPSKRATFVAPRRAGQPARLEVFRQTRRGPRLRLAPGMTGQVHLSAQGGIQDVRALLQTTPPKSRLRRTDRGFREFLVSPGDAGVVVLDETADLKLQWSFVDPPDRIARPSLRRREPWLVRVLGTTTVAIGALLALVLTLAPRVQDDSLTITQERYTKYVAPEAPKLDAARAQAKAESDKRKQREAAMSKRAKDTQGKLGRKDAVAKTTVLPKGREDVLREKVQKTGLLAAIGTAKSSGSGLGKLLTNTDSDLDQAVNGLAGAQLAVGQGAGGLGSAGTGLGGGGTGFGRIRGSGDVDVGAGRGRGRRPGPGLGARGEKEVQVGLGTGKADTDGGLTREQVDRVVRSHFAALRYCYEKEVQRAPNLTGKVQMHWVIRPNGTVDRAKSENSTLGNANVEGCMERQVRNWVFPKATAETIVNYPFFFKGAT